MPTSVSLPRLSRRQFARTTAVTAASLALFHALPARAAASVEYRTLGRNGLKVSAVGIGTNNFGQTMDAAAVQAVVDKALDIGVTLFDTAESYAQGKSEELLGAALGKRRKDAVIATKSTLGTRAAVIEACEKSLKRLGTDYIDLYQIHRPDPNAPLEETLRAMDELVKQGKVLTIGHSNYDGALTAAAEKFSADNKLARYISAQNHYSLLTRDIEKDLVPACEANGVGILPYFPLESGLLTGKYKRGEKPEDGTRFATWAARGGNTDRFFGDARFAKAEQLQEIADANATTLLDMAFGWLLSKPYVGSVIAGATKPEQVESNVAASSWRPTAEVNAAIDKVTLTA